VNGKPVYYWKNAECGRIPEGAGQIILANCTNVTIENQNLNNGSIGMLIVFSSGITLKNNTCFFIVRHTIHREPAYAHIIAHYFKGRIKSS